MQVIAGTAVLATATFTNTAGVVTDPSTVTLKYQGGSGTVTTVAQASLTHVGTGVWSYILDTTSDTEGTSGNWTVEFIGTGSCAAVQTSIFTVISQPI